jgi:mannose-6-phosphate isomerase-like protein (cupin superfamily)
VTALGDTAPVFQLTPTMAMRTLARLAALSMDLLDIQPGGIRTPVVHDHCDEIIYVRDGTLEITVGGQVQELTEGQAIAIPRGTPHGSVNRTDQVVRLIAANSPAFEIADEREASDA